MHTEKIQAGQVHLTFRISENSIAALVILDKSKHQDGRVEFCKFLTNLFVHRLLRPLRSPHILEGRVTALPSTELANAKGERIADTGVVRWIGRFRLYSHSQPSR